MKVYEAIFKEGENEGVYSLSVVENPAMEDMWIALSEHPQKIELAAVDEEKRLLLGAALIPNKRIYRNIDGNEFEMFFTEATIEKLAHSFMKNQNNNNSSLEHELKLEGMSVVEAWTVQDPLTDKSASYGKNYPKGTWVTMMKVDNDEMWNKAKNGEIKGFSIDALLGLQEIQLNTNIKTESMTKQDFLDAFKAIFSVEEKVEEVEKIEVVAQEVAEEVAEPTMDLNALKEALTETLAQFSVSVDEKFEAFKVEFTNQLSEKDVEIETKTKEVENLKVELDKQPESAAIKSNPEVKVEYGQNKPKGRTMQERVFESFNNN